MLRSLIDFGRPGRIALSEHRGTLGLEGHHAPQHADRLGGVVHADEAAGAEPTRTQPILRGLARALDRVPVDGGADLGESTAFADDEARERDGSGVRASASRRPSASIRAPTSRPSSAARSTPRTNRPMRSEITLAKRSALVEMSHTSGRRNLPHCGLRLCDRTMIGKEALDVGSRVLGARFEGLGAASPSSAASTRPAERWSRRVPAAAIKRSSRRGLKDDRRVPGERRLVWITGRAHLSE